MRWEQKRNQQKLVTCKHRSGPSSDLLVPLSGAVAWNPAGPDWSANPCHNWVITIKGKTKTIIRFSPDYRSKATYQASILNCHTMSATTITKPYPTMWDQLHRLNLEVPFRNQVFNKSIYWKSNAAIVNWQQ